MILKFSGSFENDKKVITDYHDSISKIIDNIMNSFEEIQNIWKDVNDTKVEIFKNNAQSEIKKIKELNIKNLIAKEEQYRSMDNIMTRING